MPNVDMSRVNSYGSRPNIDFRLHPTEKDARTLRYPRVNKGGDHDGLPTLQPAVMGVELEIGFTPTTPRDVIDQVYNSFATLDPTFIHVKNDSSLGGQGVEIVSSPATLAFHKGGIWDKFFDEVAPHLQGATFPAAGIHIHINKWSFLPTSMAKFCSFINNPANRQFLEKIAGRNANSYCEFDPARHRITSCNGNKVDQGTKYRAINMGHSSRNTAEIRMFASTADKATFMKNIEFIHNLRLFCFETSIREIDVHHFMTWLAKNANGSNKYLRAFLDDQCDDHKKKAVQAMAELPASYFDKLKTPKLLESVKLAKVTGTMGKGVVFTHK